VENAHYSMVAIWGQWLLTGVRRTRLGHHAAALAAWRSTAFLHSWAPFVVIVFCLRGSRFAYVADDRSPESALIPP